MDRIDAMQAFVRVVETGSFTRAAETLQASKTRVTQLVQQLETHPSPLSAKNENNSPA